MKNKVLKAISWIMGIVLLVAICFIDSETPVPFMVACIALVWLAYFGWANDWGEE